MFLQFFAHWYWNFQNIKVGLAVLNLFAVKIIDFKQQFKYR